MLAEILTRLSKQERKVLLSVALELQTGDGSRVKVTDIILRSEIPPEGFHPIAETLQKKKLLNIWPTGNTNCCSLSLAGPAVALAGRPLLT